MGAVLTASLVLAEFPFKGTMLDPIVVLKALSKPDVFYHLWVAVRLTIER